MINEVKVWYMSEEERLAYIEKHPIKKSQEKGKSFAQLDERTGQRIKERNRKRWGNTGYTE